MRSIHRRQPVWLLFYLAVAGSAAAQTPLIPAVNSTEPPAATPEETAKQQSEAIDAKRDEVARKLETARRAIQSTDSATGSTTAAPEKAAREVELLSQLELSLGQQKVVGEQLKELETTRNDLQAKLDVQRSAAPGEIEPMSFLELDRVRDELAAEQARAQAFTSAVSTAEQSLGRAQTNAAEKERDRLKAKEALETNRDEASVGKLTQQHKLAELEAKQAVETAKLREMQLTSEKLNAEVHNLRIAVYQAQIERHSASATFTQAELDSKLDEIAHEEDNLRGKVALAEHDFAALDEEWIDKKQQLDMSASPGPELRELIEKIRLERNTEQQRISILGQRLERLGRMRTAYKRRFKVITGTPLASELKEWEADTRQYLEQLGQESRLHTIRVDQLRKEMMNVEAKAQASQDVPAAVANIISKQRDPLEALSRSYDNDFVSIEAARQLHEKLLAEIGVDVESLSAAQRMEAIWQGVADAWNYPLMSVEDRPITPGKIVGCLVLMLIGYLAARFLSGLLGRRILPRVGMNESAASAMQSLAFYFLVAMVTLFSLHLVNVPLTLFTFLGGALAIGVGFGSQNIVNNFISGLILLAERPIRQGDMIQLDGLYGTIEHIGARSTRVRTATNVEIIVPNSRFLESNVVNWTLSDDKIRTGIKIGVAYGSTTREVARLLKRAADEHGLIMSNPEPFVWFTDFGDNSLQFELHFWVTMRTLSERMRIESDIRHRIDSLFGEAGIVISFPQRDVHLDAVRPIEVRMLPASDEQSIAPPSKAA